MHFKTFLKIILAALLISCGEPKPAPEKTASDSVAQQGVSQSFIDVSADSAFALIQKHASDSNFVVLDIRTPAEYEREHIPNAKMVNFRADDFSQNLEMLDKQKTYVVHCASGRRSAQAIKVMQELGFEKVYHMNRGMRQWQEKKLPLEK